MTTTQQLIEKLLSLEGMGPSKSSATCGKAAQRLKELYKPDCEWEYVGGNTNYIMECNKRANGVWSLYCPNCGGAVKEAT